MPTKAREEEDPSAWVIACFGEQGHFGPKNLAKKSYIFWDKCERRRLRPGVYNEPMVLTCCDFIRTQTQSGQRYMSVSMNDKEWQQ